MGQSPWGLFLTPLYLKETKQCRVCKEDKPLTSYHVHDHKTGKLRNDCKDCRRIKTLTYRYGISNEDYDSFMHTQKGVCAICGTATPTENHDETRPNLYVDHCHTSGAVRGLLCSSCNTGLGLFKDNPERLKAAIQYLTK